MPDRVPDRMPKDVLQIWPQEMLKRKVIEDASPRLPDRTPHDMTGRWNVMAGSSQGNLGRPLKFHVLHPRLERPLLGR